MDLCKRLSSILNIEYILLFSGVTLFLWIVDSVVRVLILLLKSVLKLLFASVYLSFVTYSFTAFDYAMISYNYGKENLLLSLKSKLTFAKKISQEKDYLDMLKRVFKYYYC